MRKGYQKPALKKVKLMTEEAVLTACKFWYQYGPGVDWCYYVHTGKCQTYAS